MKILLSLFAILFLLKTPVIAQSSPLKNKVVHSAEIYFDFGRHDLKSEADSVLKKIAEAFKTNPNLAVSITAHTDSIGTNQNNQRLSERRAEMVSYALAALGIPAKSLQIQVFGEGKPAVANRTDEGRQRNRRATIELVEQVKMTPLEGKVVDPKTGKGIEADVIVHGKEFRDSTSSDYEGYWHVNVPEGVVVGVDVVAEGFFLESKMIKVQPGKMPPVVIDLRPAEAGASAEIENLFFVGDQAMLLETSKPELPKVLRFMQVNKDIKIEIAGHVNYPNRPPVTKESWEFGLSQRRAKLVYDYLLENGIAEERISWKGYGNWEMRFPHATSDKDQAANRRVEIRVLGKR
ncbi:MAG: OmpA family protein [Bacteroidota bacterium]